MVEFSEISKQYYILLDNSENMKDKKQRRRPKITWVKRTYNYRNIFPLEQLLNVTVFQSFSIFDCAERKKVAPYIWNPYLNDVHKCHFEKWAWWRLRVKFAWNSSKYSCSDGILIEVNSYVKLKFCKVESKKTASIELQNVWRTCVKIIWNFKSVAWLR